MAYKFEKLEVWNRALDYVDELYAIAGRLPDHERYNLCSQMRRAGTSIALNIAEGSTSGSDAEQARHLRSAIRSLVETVACIHLVRRHGYLADDLDALRAAYRTSQTLFAQLQAFRRALGDASGMAPGVREDEAPYAPGDDPGEPPF
jgi:four helix bundle protein